MQRSGVHPMKREEIIWQSIANLSCSTQPLGALPGYLTALCVTLHFLALVGRKHGFRFEYMLFVIPYRVVALVRRGI